VVQLLLHLWFNICILAYSIVQIPQTYDALNALGDQQCGSYAVSDTLPTRTLTLMYLLLA
jgi:hypothetical protein